MSLADQVTNLTNDRNNIRTSLINKGITEAAGHGFSSFDEDIDAMVKPEGTITVTENGEYDVTEREGIIVDVYTVTPIESPEADISGIQTGGIIRVVWNTVPDAICYTLERKHGENGAWTVIRTLATSSEETYTYIDADVIAGDEYYYRVYAISDGATYGNSLPSNIAYAVAPNGGGYTNIFSLNNYCEDVSGGWIVEPYELEPSRFRPLDIEPYTPTINSDGVLDVVRGGSPNDSGAVWVHTVNPIRFDCNDIDIFERLNVTYKRVGQYTNFEYGVFRLVDGVWERYPMAGITTSYVTHRLIFKNNPSSPSAPGNIPAGEYYVGFILHTYSNMHIQVNNVSRSLVTWDGKLFNKMSQVDSEITEITGGYNPSDTAYANFHSLTVKRPEKTIPATDTKYVTFTPPSGSCCSPIITGRLIDLGGFEHLVINGGGSVYSTKSAAVVFLNKDFEVIDSQQVSVSSNMSIALSDTVRSGGSYYIVIEINDMRYFYLYNIYLTYPDSGG